MDRTPGRPGGMEQHHKGRVVTASPQRGEIWLLDLDPTRGHEQAGRRPALIFSVDAFNAGPADLVFVVPITSHLRPIPTQVVLRPPEGGIKTESAILCDALRSVSKQRLCSRWGRIAPHTMNEVADRVRILLGL
jgi:mRNA interferase MazF